MSGNIENRLFSLCDEPYRDGTRKLIPAVNAERIIGVRTPELRLLAAELWKNGEYADFISELPHRYYEENNLHSYLIARIKDFGRCLCEVERFLPFVDNWATCDGLRPAVFARYPKELLPHIEQWIDSEHCYTVRFGIAMLMSHYLKDNFDEVYPKKVAAIHSDEYYINMMRAWYFAEALTAQQDCVLPYFERGVLDEWTRKKAIQKARESFRVDDEIKQRLAALR